MQSEKQIEVIKSALTQALGLGLFKSFQDVQVIMLAVANIESDLNELKKIKAEAAEDSRLP